MNFSKLSVFTSRHHEGQRLKPGPSVDETYSMVVNPLKEIMGPLQKMSTFRPSKVVNEAKEIISELLVTVDTIMNKPQPVLTKEDQLESPATFSFKRDI